MKQNKDILSHNYYFFVKSTKWIINLIFPLLIFQNLKAQKSRREQFSGSVPVVSDLPAAALTGGPFGSSQNGSKGSVLLRDAYQAHGGEAVAIDMAAADHQPRRSQIQQQVFADETESYLQSRSDAVQSIESTIVELGGIFQQLALMVREQEEMVQR